MKKILLVFTLFSAIANAGLKEGQIAYSQKNYEVAFKEFLPLAEAGNPSMQNQIGFMYDNGRGVAKNREKAIEWYRKAVEQNYAPAQYNLGASYFEGDGVAKNKEAAATLFELAANQGHIQAQSKLAIMYSIGDGVPYDYKKAIDLYRKAGSKGDEMAQYNLGTAYCNQKEFMYQPSICYALLSISAKQDPTGISKAALDMHMKDMSATQIDLGKKLAVEMSKPDNFLPALDTFSSSHPAIKK